MNSKRGFFTHPRILGIALIIIAALAAAAGSGFLALGIAGIILLITPKKYTQQQFDLFTDSFSDWKTILFVAVYDALFWTLFIGAAYFYRWRFLIKTATAQAQSTLSTQGLLNPALATQTEAALRGWLLFFFIGIGLLLLFTFLIYTLSRTLIWTTIAEQKPTKRFFTKFCALNAVWWLIWLIPALVLIVASTKDPAVGILLLILFVLMAHFTLIAHALFTKTHQIGSSIGHAIAFGIAKIHRFIIPYTFVFVIYLILYQPFRIVQTLPIAQAASMLFVVVYLAWLRTYLYPVVLQLKD